MSESFDRQTLERLMRTDPFNAADRAFVRLLEDRYGESDPYCLLAGGLALAVTREGHSFLDLSSPPTALDFEDWPTLVDWATRLDDSPSSSTTERIAPLVFEDGFALYLRKYYEYENRLAQAIGMKACSSSDSTSTVESDNPDLQKHAVERALENKLYLISGGPGTGKTTTVLDYLIQALNRWTHPLPCRIAAVAPTGKAAARLSESVQNGLDRFELDASTRKTVLSIPCMTIHRLLQGLPFQTAFRRNKENPIGYDLLVIDESSMIDLPLMEKLFDALPEETAIVLLGDHHQLSSVEVGSVFGDLLQSSANEKSPLFGKSTTLQKTYRFPEDSSIYRFCEAAKFSNADVTDQLLNGVFEDFTFQILSSDNSQAFEPMLELIVDNLHFRRRQPDVQAAFASLNHFTLLTPFNQGPFGSRSLNELSHARVRHSLNLGSEDIYPGMPLIILENNYDIELFNGDIGLVWPDDATGENFAWFSDAQKGLRRIRLNRLPRYDFAYCLTIHKSQGSEFDHVAGVFPADENHFITRELVYTCASRARKRLSLFGHKPALIQAIQRSVKRATRLEEQILSAP